KRVFLVLDDVWKDKAFDSLDLVKGNGSVTLLTIRNQSLLERANQRISQVCMIPLSKQDSWSLFCVHAFKPPSHVPCELKNLAQSMAEECKVLPLALKVIGEAMFRKTSPKYEWELLLKKLKESRLQEKSVEEELYECLKLGYDLLSEDDGHLKDLPAHDEDDPRADIFLLLKKLLSRSFIESNVKVLVEEFKVHDVMRKLAFYILGKDSLLGNFPKLRVLDLRNGKFDRLLEEVGNLTNLVCLDLSYCINLKILPDIMLKYLPSRLVKLTSLQILDGEGFDTWAEHTPSNIGRIESLDHVYPNKRASLEDICKLVVLTKLSISGVVKLPYNISALTKLKILRLELANVRTMPAEMVNEAPLPKLRTLEFESCECLESLPLSLEVLTNLRKLIMLNCVDALLTSCRRNCENPIWRMLDLQYI
ncbi:hypothetical protein CY35_03G140500, partial [Sphagnum magellanicum]